MVESPCWKHRWLHAEGWDAFGIWLEARWDPLTTEERWALVVSVVGWPAHINRPDEIDEFGDLSNDTMLSIEVYAVDPELPRHMIEPFVPIFDPNWPF